MGLMMLMSGIENFPRTRKEVLAERDRCKEECRKRDREQKVLTRAGYETIDKMKGKVRDAM